MGGAVRSDRWAAVSRHHRLEDLLRRRRRGLGAALRIWDGGLGIWGAVALGGVGAWIGCRRRGIPLPAFGDAIAPGIVLAQAIGRLGNYFNQELYGRPTTLPWGLEIYERRDASGALDSLNGVSTGQLHQVEGPPHLPVRITLERPGFRCSHLGGSPVQDRPRPAVRAVRGGVLRRPVLDRADAQRYGHAYRGHSDQFVHVDVRVHRRGGVHHGRAEGPRRSCDACRQA